VRSSGSRCGTHHAGVAANLRSSARADRRWRDLPSPSEPARVEPVDRRDSCCCLADPEGSESPFTPHRVPLRAWSQGEPDSVEGEKTWSPGNSEGTGWGQWLGPGLADRQDGEATRRRLAGPGTGGNGVEPGPTALGAGQEPTERPPSDELSPGSSRGAGGGRPSASDSAATADSGAGDPPALREVASQESEGRSRYPLSHRRHRPSTSKSRVSRVGGFARCVAPIVLPPA
jgi:hypothetical protein